MSDYYLLRTRPRLAAIIFFAVVVCGAGASEAQRLPASVVPENYKLQLEISISDKKFSGEETISVRVAQPVTEIVLNSLDLEITQAEVTSGGFTQTAKAAYDKPAEMARLALERRLAAGPATIHLKFSAPLTESLRGLYLSKSPRRAYAVTQFEGTYARMMFPCFDEPAFKATFDLAVVIDKGDNAISNGRSIADEPMGEVHKITFATSPRMSTYLVALAVGDWRCLEKNVDGIPIRVCAVPEKKDHGEFALEVAAYVVRYYNQWYGIRYPFGKLDMVAIPDYEWGGMENTAAIFYRDTALLLNEETASVAAKRGHATVVAHEIAHQWFGDLVTAAWWDDIWLNEGFASWMERKPIAAWKPDWNLELDDAASAQQIIGLDSLAAARPIHGDPKTSSEIKEMFDGITYQKGAAVLRMLEAYVGPEVFRRGVNQYLQEHANGNATSEDFWRALARVSGKPVDKIMPTFVMQPGVPVVSMAGECTSEKTSLRMEQQRFTVSGQPTSAQQWQVPVCLKMPGQKDAQCFLLAEKTQQFSLNSCPAWIFGNRGADGYYRMANAPAMLTRMAGAAEKELTPAERIALVEDAWAMTRAGKYPVGLFLDLAQAMRAERELPVINLLAAHLENIGASVVPENQRSKYDEFVRRQFAPLAAELGWSARSGESDERRALRARLLSVLGGAGDPDALAAARATQKKYMQQPGSVDPTLVAPAFAVAAHHAGPELYQDLYDSFLKAHTPDAYYQYLFALAAVPQPALAPRTLALVEQDKVRQQDYPSLFAALLSNPASRPAAWAYLKAHWDSLATKVTSFGGRGAISALGEFCSAAERDDVQQFFAAHRPPGAERTLQQSLERINQCIEFKQLQQANMAKWLAGEAKTGN
ncbi:MAG TPA: M1 family metallopeptidase [Candidatus Angelobacter sp.]